MRWIATAVVHQNNFDHRQANTETLIQQELSHSTVEDALIDNNDFKRSMRPRIDRDQ